MNVPHIVFNIPQLCHTLFYATPQFLEHILTFGLKISDEKEFAHRLSVFASNTDLIESHNAKNLTWSMGHNQFSHLTSVEFKENYLSRPTPRKEGSRVVNAFDGVVAPSSVDWSTSGAVR